VRVGATIVLSRRRRPRDMARGGSLIWSRVSIEELIYIESEAVNPASLDHSIRLIASTSPVSSVALKLTYDWL